MLLWHFHPQPSWRLTWAADRHRREPWQAPVAFAMNEAAVRKNAPREFVDEQITITHIYIYIYIYIYIKHVYYCKYTYKTINWWHRGEGLDKVKCFAARWVGECSPGRAFLIIHSCHSIWHLSWILHKFTLLFSWVWRSRTAPVAQSSSYGCSYGLQTPFRRPLQPTFVSNMLWFRIILANPGLWFTWRRQ